MEKQALSQLAVKALENIKAQNIVCLNVEELTQITDYMVIATGNSTTHIKSLADEVTRQVKAAGAEVIGEEGRLPGEWVLVDLGAVIVHIMLANTRALYSLEDLWNFSAADSASDKTAEKAKSKTSEKTTAKVTKESALKSPKKVAGKTPAKVAGKVSVKARGKDSGES